MEFKPLEIFVIILSFLIVFALLRLFRGETLADRKREQIEMKRQAIIAKRKAEATEAREQDKSVSES